MSKKLFLIDGTAIIYRSYYAFIRNPLINSKGENTSAVFGFTNAILQILKQYKPEYLGIAFDTAAPTFRKELYDDYKANRKEMPDELAAQLSQIDELVKAFNIPILRLEGYEADDVMGTLAKKAESEEDVEIYLVTSDKDFYQLIDDRIKVLIPPKRGSETRIIERDGVIEKFGVPPEQVIEVMGLMGDSSDNIPGVPRVGPKTATELVQEFGSLEAAIANAEEYRKKSIRKNLKEYAEQARLSKELVTIKTDAPIDLDWNMLTVGEWHNEDLLSLFRKLEFNSLLQELTSFSEFDESVHSNLEFNFSSSLANKEVQYELVDNVETFNLLLGKLRSAKVFAYDTETTDIDPIKAELVGVSFSFEPGEAYYIPLAHVSKKNLPMDVFIEKIKPIMEDENVGKIGQNIKYDNIILSHYDINVNGVFFDTMIASYLISPESHQHNLDVLALQYLNHKMMPITDLIGSGRNQLSFAQVAIADAVDYSAEDADITFRLYQIFSKMIRKQNLEKLLKEIEMPLCEVLKVMELNGVKVDSEFLKNLSEELDTDLKRLTDEIYEFAGEPFNINSPQQLSHILFDVLKLPPQRKTKTGQYSTDVNVLETLSSKHPLPQKLLDYRQLAKLKSTYVDALIELINPKTQKVHTSFNQTVASTGRLSSSNPNLQNIPIRTEVGKKIRKAFIPSYEDWFLVSADYSQVELRVMAHLSQDENLMEAFLNDEDVHTRTASLVFGVPPEDVDSDMRRQAKIINFGVMYGMGEWKFSQDIGVSMGEARRFIKNYFRTYTGVKQYIDETIETAKKDGYVATIFDRKRKVPDLHAKSKRRRNFAEHIAINTPIQGSAADIIKIAMIDLQNEIEKRELKSLMTLQVHDELLFDVPEDELAIMKPLIKEKMENAVTLSVPLKVDIGVGKNWLEAH
jgi:DNA polymerase-1